AHLPAFLDAPIDTLISFAWLSALNRNKDGSNIDGSARHPQRFGPKRRRRLRQLDDITYRAHELIPLFRRHHQRRGRLQDHEVVPTNLRENPLLTKHSHDHNLSEHGRMDAVKSLIKCPKREFSR